MLIATSLTIFLWCCRWLLALIKTAMLKRRCVNCPSTKRSARTAWSSAAKTAACGFPSTSWRGMTASGPCKTQLMVTLNSSVHSTVRPEQAWKLTPFVPKIFFLSFFYLFLFLFFTLVGKHWNISSFDDDVLGLMVSIFGSVALSLYYTVILLALRSIECMVTLNSSIHSSIIASLKTGSLHPWYLLSVFLFLFCTLVSKQWGHL